MLIKDKRLYEQARSRVVTISAEEVFELREKIEKLTDDVKAKILEPMPVLVEEATTLLEEVSRLRKFAMKGVDNVAVLSGLQEEVLAVK